MAIEVLGYLVLAVALTATTYAVARYGGEWFR